jgi:hypothetical protein
MIVNQLDPALRSCFVPHRTKTAAGLGREHRLYFFGLLGSQVEFTEARHWSGFLQALGPFSLTAGLVGWRRSADRTCL